MASLEMHEALPRLADDEVVGKLTDHVVPRDGAPDLRFEGTLIASAAPDAAPRGRWHEFRIYRTKSGNLICSKIGRSMLDGERDKFEATGVRLATPTWSSVESLFNLSGDHISSEVDKRSEIERGVITEFFGWSELAKQLYQKAGLDTDVVID